MRTLRIFLDMNPSPDIPSYAAWNTGKPIAEIRNLNLSPGIISSSLHIQVTSRRVRMVSPHLLIASVSPM